MLSLLGVACGGSDAGTHSSASGAGGHTPCTACALAGSGGVAGEGGHTDESGAGANDDEAGAAGSAGEAGAAGTSDAPEPSAVAISEVSFWQAMRVPLEIAGEAVAPNAPLVTGKTGILRVFVAPGASFEPRALSATLSIGADAVPASSTKVIRAASQNGDFETTFNFPFDAPDVLATQPYSVVLQDGAGGPVLARYPASGTVTLDTVSAGPTLNVVVVPLIVGGVTPDTSAVTLAKLRARVLSLYPLADFTLTAHAPLVSNIAVGPDTGWDETLDELYALRASDAPPDNVYYFGLFTPTTRFDDYCVSDCTVGLSQVAGPNEVEYRGSIGLGIFADGSNASAADTMAHELGHALGRQHSPCNVSAPPGYPYPGGKIGVWGFDSLNHLLLDPALYGDVMGYCSPDWISDYTYSALFTRIQYVNGLTAQDNVRATEVPASAYRRVLVDAHGGLRWGARFVPSAPSSGEVRAVILLGAQGEELGNVAGYARVLSDEKSSFVSVPEAALDPATGVTAIRLGNAELSLDAPKP